MKTKQSYIELLGFMVQELTNTNSESGEQMVCDVHNLMFCPGDEPLKLEDVDWEN